MKLLVVTLVAVLGQTELYQSMDRAVEAAMRKAQDDFRQQIESTPALRDVERIGISSIQGEITVANNQGNPVSIPIESHLRTMLTRVKPGLELDLIKDDELAPVLEEFVRGELREDIMGDTAQKLALRGVQAVFWLEVNNADVRKVNEGFLYEKLGSEATVDLSFNLAGTLESNPGTMLWAYKADGAGKHLENRTWNERLQLLFQENTYILIGVGILLALAFFVLLVRWMATPH